MKGRSPTTCACFAPRVTAAQWYTIWSIVTRKVESWPCTTMPRESPTRIASAPASSKIRENVASYAVTMHIFWPILLRLCSVWMVMLSFAISMPQGGNCLRRPKLSGCKCQGCRRDQRFSKSLFLGGRSERVCLLRAVHIREGRQPVRVRLAGSVLSHCGGLLQRQRSLVPSKAGVHFVESIDHLLRSVALELLELALGIIPEGSSDLGLRVADSSVEKQPLEIQECADVRNCRGREGSPVGFCAQDGSAPGPYYAQSRQKRRLALGDQGLRRGALRKSSLQVGAGLQRRLNKSLDLALELCRKLPAWI